MTRKRRDVARIILGEDQLNVLARVGAAVQYERLLRQQAALRRQFGEGVRSDAIKRLQRNNAAIARSRKAKVG